MEDLPPPLPRHEAPGGWRRAVVGVLCGATLGLWLTRLMPRDERLTRTWWRSRT